MTQLEFSFADEAMVAMAGRALYWPPQKALLVADTHFGKTATFRSAGIRVPETIIADLDRLSSLLSATSAGRLIVLGDLLHAPSGRAPPVLDRVRDWRREHDLPMTLIRGNHDRRASDPPEDWHIEVVDGPLIIAGLALAHDPEDLAGRAGIAGHIHPAICLSDVAQTIRFPCFHIGQRRLILPAFGSFTGGKTLPLREKERAIIEADGALLQISG